MDYEKRQKAHDWQERMERCREAMCRAYDERVAADDDSATVTLYACVDGNHYAFEGLVFGVDEIGVGGAGSSAAIAPRMDSIWQSIERFSLPVCE